MPEAGCRGLHYLTFPFTHYPIRHTHGGRTNTHRILLIWTHSGLNFHLAEMHGHTARFLHRSCEIGLHWLFWILRQRRIYKNIQDVTIFLLFKKKHLCWMSAAELSCAIHNILRHPGVEFEPEWTNRWTPAAVADDDPLCHRCISTDRDKLKQQ